MTEQTAKPELDYFSKQLLLFYRLAAFGFLFCGLPLCLFAFAGSTTFGILCLVALGLIVRFLLRKARYVKSGGALKDMKDRARFVKNIWNDLDKPEEPSTNA